MNQKKTQLARMTHGEFYRLCEWLKQDGRLDQPVVLVELERQAGEHMGHPVHSRTLRDAAEAVGLTITLKSKAQPAPMPMPCDGRVQALAKVVIALCIRFGEPVPDDVKDLARGDA